MKEAIRNVAITKFTKGGIARKEYLDKIETYIKNQSINDEQQEAFFHTLIFPPQPPSPSP